MSKVALGLGGDPTIEPLRFMDVVGELHRIAELARAIEDGGGSEIAAACHRAESLLTRLRNQFVEDLLSDGRAWETSAA